MIQLSKLENKVLKYLLDNQDRAVYTDDILLGVWEGVGAEANVYMAIQKIRKKIEGDPRHPEYIITLTGGGYLLNAENIKTENGKG